MKLTIGENIRNFRKKNDLTQETLADRLGVTYQSVSRWGERHYLSRSRADSRHCRGACRDCR